MSWFSRWGALLACALGLPALRFGLVADDYILASRLQGPSGIRWQGLLDAFSIVPQGQAASMRALGELPWWSDPTLKLSFLRPLSALTHALDFAFLPPVLMHVESLALLLALNLAVARWYRHLLGAQYPLALALFVTAPGHVFAASWLANRNALLASLFAVLALIAYDGERRAQRSPWRSLLALLLALLSGELGLSTMALLLAYAVCLDGAPRAERLRALLPAGLLTATWLVLHPALGYGARASSLYVSPLESPLRYVGALLQNAPVLLFSQWGLPCVALKLLLSRPAGLALLALCVGCLLAWTPRVLRVVRADPRARFCALGSVLALLPISATAVHDRLMLVADVAGLALVALAVQVRPTRALRALMTVRLALASLLALAYAASLEQHVEQGVHPFASIAREPEVAQQSVVFVNSPCIYYPMQLRWLRAYQGEPVPGRLRMLAPGIYPLVVERIDERTLRVSSDGGLLQPLGTYGALGEPPGWLSPVYLAQVLNQFPRSAWSYQGGDALQLGDMEVHIERTTSEGYPRSVTFRLTRPLPHYVFLAWQRGRYEPFVLPSPGARVELAAARM